MTEPEMFTTEWRAWRVREGDRYLAAAMDDRELDKLNLAPSHCIAIAQAHYQAANIRSRPGESAATTPRRVIDPLPAQ